MQLDGDPVVIHWVLDGTPTSVTIPQVGATVPTTDPSTTGQTPSPARGGTRHGVSTTVVDGIEAEASGMGVGLVTGLVVCARGGEAADPGT